MKTALEQLDKFEALARRIATEAKKSGDGLHVSDYEMRQIVFDANAILAELPKPVDPDLVDAREIVALSQHPSYSPDNAANRYRSGEWDNDTAVRHCLSALRRAREEGVR